MPEGDTLHRIALTLGRVLAGREVRAFRSPLPALSGALLVGARIEAITARGKNLLVRFDDGRVLHTHLRMSGSWHLYHPGERWKRPASFARVVLEVEGAVAVCFSAPVVRLLRAGAAERDPELASLGPDLLAPEPDVAAAVARLRALGDAPLGVALLDQRAVAGIGNVYKSEVLFRTGADPFATVDSYDDAALARVLGEAVALLCDNVRRREGGAFVRRGRATRVAADRERAWVYGRRGEPCLVCGGPVAMRRQGPALRSTYHCPTCQPARVTREAPLVPPDVGPAGGRAPPAREGTLVPTAPRRRPACGR